MQSKEEPDKVLSERQKLFSEACRAKNIELVEQFLSDPEFFNSVRSDTLGIFENLKDFDNETLYSLLSTKMSGPAIVTDAAQWGNVSYFEYLFEKKPNLVTPVNLHLAFRAAAHNRRPEAVNYLCDLIKSSEDPEAFQAYINAVISDGNYAIVKKLARDIRDGIRVKESQPILDKILEIAPPELSPQIRGIIEGINKIPTYRPAQIEPTVKTFQPEELIVDQLRVLCEDYHAHLSKQKKTSNPELSELLNLKIAIVSKLMDKLNDDSNLKPENKIIEFKEILNDTNKDFLKIRKDGRKFLEMIGTILEMVGNIASLGIYSKITKDTFQFWKSHGEAFTDKVEEISPNPKKM